MGSDARKPRPFVRYGIQAGWCIEAMGGQRFIEQRSVTLTARDAEAYQQWLGNAVAWCRSARREETKHDRR